MATFFNKLGLVKQNSKSDKNNAGIISLHELPIGKQRFRATVNKIVYEKTLDCCGVEILTPYLHLKDLKILISNTWVDVNCSGNSIRSKIGKRIADLGYLCEEDILCFDAQVRDCSVQFKLVEGEDIIDENNLYYSPFGILPKNYEGNIVTFFRVTSLPNGELDWNDDLFSDVLAYDNTDEYLKFARYTKDNKSRLVSFIMMIFL